MTEITSDMQDLVDEIKEHGGEVRLPEGNVTHPMMFARIMNCVEEWYVGYFADDEPDSPWECELTLKNDLTFEDGLMIGNFLGSVFTCEDWNWHEHEGQFSVKMLGNL